MTPTVKLALSAMLVCAISGVAIKSAAQDALVTFSNGEVADATDINNNFENLDGRIKALEGYNGCSATQDGSSVVITCADGSSGVLASSGTVVVYPEGGILGEVSETLSSGQIVFKDANDVVVAVGESVSATIRAAFEINGRELLGNFYNDHENQQVIFSGLGGVKVYFQSTDCTGQPLGLPERPGVYDVQRNFLTVAEGVQRQSYLTMSVISAGSADFNRNNYSPSSECQSIQTIVNGVPLVNMALPEEIINAAYPVRLEQLP